MAAVYASALDPTMEELSDFKTAVSEAVTNAIIHAYPNSTGKIVLRFERQQKVTSEPGRGTTVFLTKKISGAAGDEIPDDFENEYPDTIKGENIEPYL